MDIRLCFLFSLHSGIRSDKSRLVQLLSYAGLAFFLLVALIVSIWWHMRAHFQISLVKRIIQTKDLAAAGVLCFGIAFFLIQGIAIGKHFFG